MPVDKYRHCNMTIYMIFAFQIWYFPTKKKNVIHLFKLLLCEHKVWYVYLAIVQMNLWHSIYHDVVEYKKLIFSHKLRSRSISHLVLSHRIVSFFAYDVYKHLNIYTLKQFEYGKGLKLIFTAIMYCLM